MSTQRDPIEFIVWVLERHGFSFIRREGETIAISPAGSRCSLKPIELAQNPDAVLPYLDYETDPEGCDFILDLMENQDEFSCGLGEIDGR